MKVLKLALCAAVASFAMAGAASAQEVSFNVGVTTDYVFRGASQSDEEPAVFGGVDVGSGLFYAGAWASTVDFGDDTVAEYDLYAGVKPTAGAVSMDFAALFYGYIDAPSGTDYDYWELKAAASVPAGPLTLGAAAYYSPDFFGVDEEALYIEANAAFSPADYVTLNAAVGQQQLDVTDDYTTWNVGAAFTVGEMFTVDFRYHDTDVDNAELYDQRVVATLKAAF